MTAWTKRADGSSWARRGRLFAQVWPPAPGTVRRPARIAWEARVDGIEAPATFGLARPFSSEAEARSYAESCLTAGRESGAEGLRAKPLSSSKIRSR